MHNNVQVIAHNRPGMNAASENFAQLQNSGFNPEFTLLEAYVEVFVQAKKPRSGHAAVDAVKGPRLCWVDELAARLGQWAQFGGAGLIRKSDGALFRCSEGNNSLL